MCIATPVRVTGVRGKRIEVEAHGRRFLKSALLLAGQKFKVGDYVLAHGELAIQVLPEKEALEIIKLASELGEH